MFDFHADRKRYFDIQILNAEKYVIPFIENSFPVKEGMRVLEIGSGEGGVLKAFINKGCTGVGVELDEPRVLNARQWLAQEIAEDKISFFVKNIYDVEVYDLGGAFDIILLKDVIEHIHDQPRLMKRLHHFLKPGGVIYFGFPPWQMPFGGHQQMCTRTLAKAPYFHLLPTGMYKGLLRLFKEPEDVIASLAEIKETGISIERFEKIVKETNYKTIHKTHFLFNPIYEWKFGLKPRRQLPVINRIPFLRNFVTTCVYYLITADTGIQGNQALPANN